MYATAEAGPTESPVYPRRTPRGTPEARVSMGKEKGLTTFPLVRPCFRLSRLSESNRRPSHYERPRNAHPGITHA
jgi:hypothetical protein